MLLHNAVINCLQQTHFRVHKHICCTKYPGQLSASLGWWFVELTAGSRVSYCKSDRTVRELLVRFRLCGVNRPGFVFGWVGVGCETRAVRFAVLGSFQRRCVLCYSPLICVQRRTISQTSLLLCGRCPCRLVGRIPADARESSCGTRQ